MKIYRRFCEKCKKTTEQVIMQMSRSKGVKTRCINCGRTSQDYINLKRLENGEK